MATENLGGGIVTGRGELWWLAWVALFVVLGVAFAIQGRSKLLPKGPQTIKAEIISNTPECTISMAVDKNGRQYFIVQPKLNGVTCAVSLGMSGVAA
jgi:hypothetical protein